MKIGRIAGVSFRINPLLLLLLVVYTALGLGYEILCILAAVIIHELAHTLAAGILGVKISEVELLPFGGQAKTEDFLGLVPEREVYIALAGPLTSLALAGGVLVAGKHGGEGYLPFFMQINLVLALFNLLPALPLDGGRVLRALLARRFGYRKATRGAAFLGQIIAVALMGYGAYEAYFLREGVNALVIGAFLFWSARKEAGFLAYAFMRYLVHKKGELSRKGSLPVYQVISTSRTLVKDLLNSTSPSSYMVILLVDDQDRIQEVITETQLIEALLDKGPLTTLGEV